MDKIYAFCSLLAALLFATASAQNLSTENFPENFRFGVATAAYQVEGAWNANGKGPSIWDDFCHRHPEWIADGSSGDVACDAYHKTAEDVALLKDMGVQFYRFSLSWARILPTGFSNHINPDGIRYYNELIDELLANGIEPMVTLYHWDLPLKLEHIGGWPNKLVAEHFENYARVAFENFGDRVKMWITFNEPKETCRGGYGGGYAPGYQSTGLADYMCAHTILLAHARAYHLYDLEFRPSQQGKIGITLNSDWYEPETDSLEDLEASERMFEFELGWYANAIFTVEGDYPAVMKERIAARSLAEGFSSSRLPEFTLEEVQSLIGTSDFFGLNHYTSSMVKDKTEEPHGDPSFWKDANVESWKDPDWPGSESTSWLKTVPWGFRKVLNYISQKYNNPEIYVTENGFSTVPGEIEDVGRREYFINYLSNLLNAIYIDEANVTLYAAWSFMDNFEWGRGYTEAFGLYSVDFEDPVRPRTPKTSVETYKRIVADRNLNGVINDGVNIFNKACINLLLFIGAFLTYVTIL